jgi:indole-3-glycerol phosphate synthase
MFNNYCKDSGLRIMILKNESELNKRLKTIKFKVIGINKPGYGELIIV